MLWGIAALSLLNRRLLSNFTYGGDHRTAFAFVVLALWEPKKSLAASFDLHPAFADRAKRISLRHVFAP